MLLGRGRHRLVACTALGEALVNLALSLVLVRYYGLVGVAIGTAVPITLGNLGILLPAACRQAGLGVGAFLRAVAIAPTIGALPALTVCLFLRSILRADSLSAIALQSSIVALVYVAAVWMVGFEKQVREQYRSYARNVIAGIGLGHGGAHAAPRIVA
jgi:hypothetical protein